MIQEQGFKIGVDHHLFHAELRAWRIRHGLTQKQVSAMAGMHSQRIGWFETFKSFPTPDEQAKLEEITGIDGGRLFPGWLKEWATGSKRVTTEHEITELMLSDGMFKSLSAPGNVEEQAICSVDQSMLKDAIGSVLEGLTQRERAILECRFGLDGEGVKTLEQVAIELGPTRERIRQIEAQAIRKLRHPSRARRLEPFVEFSKAPPEKPADTQGHYRAWLSEQAKRKDSVGLLARTIATSPCCTQSSPLGLKQHVQKVHVLTDAGERTLDLMFAEYRGAIRGR